MHYRTQIIATVTLVAWLSVHSPGVVAESSAQSNAASDHEIATAVLNVMNRKADPCEDFYEYSCGSWLKSHKIPDDKVEYSLAVGIQGVVRDQIDGEIRTLLEGELKRQKAKAGGFYASCVSRFSRRNVDLKPLLRFRPAFANLSSPESLASVLGFLHANGANSVLFSSKVLWDGDHTNRYALVLTPAISYAQSAGILLRSADIEETTEHFVRKVIDISIKAGLVPNIEHKVLAMQIQEVSSSLKNVTDSLNVSLGYSPRSLDSMPTGLAIHAYLAAAGVNPTRLNNTILLKLPEYFDIIAALFEPDSSLPEKAQYVRSYLAFQLVLSLSQSGVLGPELYDSATGNAAKELGAKRLPPIWKKCEDLTNLYFGEAVGRAYVEKHFPENQRAAASKMAREIILSFDSILKKQSWLDDETRALARKKLSLTGVKIGYSSEVDTYEDVIVREDAFAENVAAATQHAWKRHFNRLGEPLLPKTWENRNPQDSQASYIVNRNQIEINAGIIRRPFFSTAFPDAMNYGALGTFIAHELSHGEDNFGANFDAEGRLRDWWLPPAAREFENRAKCYVSLYDKYKPTGLDVNVNGSLTLGENLADGNGIKISFTAFKNTLARVERDALQAQGKNTSSSHAVNPRPKNAVLALEFTDNQLFFVSWAQQWCRLHREEYARFQIANDDHPPAPFRVQGPLSQMKEFASSFHCKPGSRYNPAQRCYLWDV